MAAGSAPSVGENAGRAASRACAFCSQLSVIGSRNQGLLKYDYETAEER